MAHAQVIESGTFRAEFRLKKAKDSVYNPLDEVVVSAYRTAEKRQRVIQEIDLIPTAKIQQSLGSSTVDVLATHASIAIQKANKAEVASSCVAWRPIGFFWSSMAFA
jgi:outer membrane cobalamin receptor